jgi:hypothetical protein
MSQRMNLQPVPADAEGVARSPGPSTRQEPTLQPQVQDHIGRQLRAVYDDILSQPVPDRFRELVEKLEAKTGGPR